MLKASLKQWRNPNSEDAAEEPELQACPKASERQTGRLLREPWIEEPKAVTPPILFTEEVRTPKASFNWGKQSLKKHFKIIKQLFKIIHKIF